MEITFKGLEHMDKFIRDLHNRLNGELKDLPSIISQMGINGEQILIEFTECEDGVDTFKVCVENDDQKTYYCAMRIGTKINPYLGFCCANEETVKDFSWQEKDKKLKILCECYYDEEKDFKIFDEDGKVMEGDNPERDERIKKIIEQV